ncbi:hypothetical protein [Actinoalloteichus fjordicus]|uniref:Uncharacterized protein n=1 Tax=Actinoalloteichus fjordicus TaxID=1612552 RepID=A0AAC9LBN1_9PSEU|nr:hypothetical protein [Actinoalloteichus fjordicus]APU13379.1 hypothetical protein UA74_06530 [Actinoalloteichus fjordicus]
MNFMTVDVALLAGYDEGPFYYFSGKGRRSNHSIEEAAAELSLGIDIVADLTAWNDEYQDTLDQDYPPDSKFPTPEAEQAWREKGKELAVRIKQESPVVASVDYQANGFYKDGTCVF